MDEVVFLDGDFAIIKSDRVFASGFNCYKAKAKGSNDFVKINGEMSWFSSFEAAKCWMDERPKGCPAPLLNDIR